VLAAARGFLSGRRSGQTPSPSTPVPPSTGDGSNSVNPLLPERRKRPISTSEQRRRAAFKSLSCELARRRANHTNTSPITSPPDRSESSNDSDGDEIQPLTQPPAIIMPRPPPSSTIDKATVIEWLHYPLGYSDGKDHSKIIISKRR
jgi:hypothetical protein